MKAVSLGCPSEAISYVFLLNENVSGIVMNSISEDEQARSLLKATSFQMVYAMYGEKNNLGILR